MAIRRRVTDGPAMNLAHVDYLLRGQLRPRAEVEAAGIEYDGFIEFDSPATLAALWREHRTALLREAERRGIAEPWGLQFDQPDDRS